MPAPEAGEVDVVAARVGDTGHGRGEVLGDEVVDGQCVDVGAQGERDGSLADVADQPGALEADRGESGGLEARDDLVRRRELLEGQFGVGVDVAAEVDELGADLSDGLGDGLSDDACGGVGTGVGRAWGLGGSRVGNVGRAGGSGRPGGIGRAGGSGRALGRLGGAGGSGRARGVGRARGRLGGEGISAADRGAGVGVE